MTADFGALPRSTRRSKNALMTGLLRMSERQGMGKSFRIELDPFLEMRVSPTILVPYSKRAGVRPANATREPYWVKWLRGSLERFVHRDHAWVAPTQLHAYDLLPADVPIAQRIAEEQRHAV